MPVGRTNSVMSGNGVGEIHRSGTRTRLGRATSRGTTSLRLPSISHCSDSRAVGVPSVVIFQRQALASMWTTIIPAVWATNHVESA